MLKWVRKIQKSDFKTKKMWVIIMSALSMFIVVIIWIAYINMIILPVEQKSASRSKNGFLTVFGKGVERLSANFIRLVKSEKNISIEK